jgi:hypothetical protein
VPGVGGYQLLSINISSPNNVGREALTPSCPAGKVAIAGGIMDIRFPITVGNSRDFNVAAIHPNSPVNWRARWYNGSGVSTTVRLYTVCINSH